MRLLESDHLSKVFKWPVEFGGGAASHSPFMMTTPMGPSFDSVRTTERPKPRKKRKGNNSEEIEHSQVVPLPKCTPALGITWTSCINTRIMLTRGNENEDVDGFLRRREMRLLLSSKYTCGTLCHYHVTRSGVNRVSDEMLQWNG